MSFYRPVVWLGKRKAQVERLCQTLQRYCQMELGDPFAIIEVLSEEPTEQKLGFLRVGTFTEDRAGISHFIIQAD